MKRIILLSLTLAVSTACKHPMMSKANTRSLGKSDPTDKPYSTLPPGVIMPGSEEESPAAGESTQSGTVSIQPVEPAPAAAENQGVVYRYLVSFFSEASGPDREGMDAFEKWVVDYGNKQKMTVAYDKIPWGREGETEICFKLEGMSAEQQSSFIAAANEQLKTAKRTNVYENSPCKHQKRP
jgi:hypothetical protein